MCLYTVCSCVSVLQYEDIEKMAVQSENHLHFRDQLTLKYIKAKEQADQWRKTLQMLEDQSKLLQLHKTSQLIQLQNELQMTHGETLTRVPHASSTSQTVASEHYFKCKDSNIVTCLSFFCPCLLPGKAA